MDPIPLIEQFSDRLADYPEWVGSVISIKLENLVNQSPLVRFALTDGLDIVRDKYDTENENRRPYHNLAHTQKVILDIVYLNAGAEEDEKLTDVELALTVAAACYHDVVQEFPGQGNKNEEESAKLAIANLTATEGPQLAYDEMYFLRMLINSTYTIVSDNKIVRTINPRDARVSEDRENAPRLSLMSKYLRDADVASLGDGSFFRSTANLAMEWGKASDTDFNDFLRTQTKILDRFEFETTAARVRCLTKIQENSDRLKKYLDITDPLNVTFAHFCEYFNLSFSDNNDVY